MRESGPARRELKQVITRAGFFALSFGSIVGSGWVVLLGEWLARASPGGTVLAILAGGAAMMLVGLCYAELAARFPRAGGEFLYILETWGRLPAFMAGWFLTLYLISICAFEGLAIALMIEVLVPQLSSPVLYTAYGQAISVHALALGYGSAVAVWAVNVAGTGTSVLLQRLITYGFIGIMAGLIAFAGLFGEASNLLPLFGGAAGSDWPMGAAWIFGTCAVLLYGFQAAAQAIEERAPGMSVGTVVRAMVAGIAAAALFYCAVVLSAASATPWEELLETRLPAAAAFGALSTSISLGTVVIAAATASLLKTWNGIVLMAARLVLAQARAEVLPPRLATLNRAQAPAAAITLVTLISMSGMLLGRGAIVPIINMAAICVSLATALCLVALLKLRARQTELPSFSAPGGSLTVWTALVLMLGMSLFAFLEPLFASGDGMPLEWILILVWGCVGLSLAIFASRRAKAAHRT